LVPGPYTITGSGGADISPFSAAVTIPALPTLVSPVNSATVTRSNGMTVTWTGGGGNLQIQVNAPTDSTDTNGSVAVCNVAASAGTFTIPPYVLLALPASNLAGFVLSSQTEVPFTATGLSVGILKAYTNDAGFGYGWGSGSFTLK
jgi:hypothetical protein